MRSIHRRRLGGAQKFLFLLPVGAALLFFLYNVLVTGVESVQQHRLAFPKDTAFIGLDNYVASLTDPASWRAFRNSVVWVVGSVVPSFLIGLAVALLLNQRFTGRALYRTLVLSPWAISGVVSAMAWVWILNGPFGVINDTLVQLGIAETRTPWLAQPDTAMPGVILASVWRGFPFFTLTLLAGLQSIDPTLYEAAAIDGANSWQKFRHITLAALKNIIVVTILVRSIWSFNWIETILLMTYGGPAGATTTWAFLMFQRFFDAGDIGYASAMAMELFVMLAVASVIVLRVSKTTDASAE